MKTATINLNVLRALVLAASTEETRYYLCGVCVEITPAHVTYFATNGHVLVGHRETVADEPNTLLGRFIVPSAACLSLKGKIPVAAVTMSTVDDKEYRLCAPAPLLFEMVDGSFPDVRRVVPPELSGEVAQFDGHYIALMEKVGAILRGDRPSVSSAAIAHNGPISPALVTWTGLPDSFGVIMPIRRKVRTDMPAWWSLDA